MAAFDYRQALEIREAFARHGVRYLFIGKAGAILLGKTKLSVMLDVFNIFQSQEATLYDDNVELTAGVTDPDFLKPVQYQAPRQWRLAARWEF